MIWNESANRRRLTTGHSVTKIAACTWSDEKAKHTNFAHTLAYGLPCIGLREVIVG